MRQALRAARRAFLTLMSCVLFSGIAFAQDYPNRPVKIIVPYPAGGVLDAMMRAIAQRLQTAVGQPFVVENMPGASGNIGLAACSRSQADGYTLCVASNDTVSISPFLFTKLSFDPRDLVPVQRLATVDSVIFAPAASHFSNFNDMLAAARAKPGAVAWGSFGVGSIGHLYMGAINKAKNVDLLHVAYKGAAPLLQAALVGEIQVGALSTGILMPHIKSGKIKPLAVMGGKRLDTLPDVPTGVESGVDLYFDSWFGIFAPAGTPKAIADRINAETTKIMNDPAFRNELGPQGFRPATLSPAEFAQYLKQDRVVGEKLVKITGVTLD